MGGEKEVGEGPTTLRCLKLLAELWKPCNVKTALWKLEWTGLGGSDLKDGRQRRTRLLVPTQVGHGPRQVAKVPHLQIHQRLACPNI